MKFIKYLLLTAIAVTIAACSTNESVTSKKTDDGIKARATKALDMTKQAETKKASAVKAAHAKKQAETKKASALKAAHAKKQADKAAETTKNPFDMGVGATKQTGTLNTVKKDTDNLKQTIINAPDTSVQDISAPSATTVQDHPTASTSTDQAAPTAVTTEQNAATALGSDNVGSASSDVKQLGVRTVDPSKSSYDSSSI